MKTGSYGRSQDQPTCALLAWPGLLLLDFAAFWRYSSQSYSRRPVGDREIGWEMREGTVVGLVVTSLFGVDLIVVKTG